MDFNKICPYCMHQIGDEGICYYCKKNPKEMQVVSHQLRPFTILQGKYLVGNILGEGGNEFTYIGLDIKLKVPVVIKEFYPNGFVTREATMTSAVTIDSSADADVVKKWKETFLREARCLAKCADLPGVLGVKDFFHENNTVYIVQEYLEGESLKNYIKSRGGKIPADELIKLMQPVINALNEVHKQGFIHRDICPDNILVLKNGKFKVLGFDIMRNLKEENEKMKPVFLRPGYAPEEQYRSRGVEGLWTDVYALCATMYKCITGVTPLESMERLRKDEMKWPSEMGISIDSNLENALKKGMAILAENRIQDMQQMYDAIYLWSTDYTGKCGNCHKWLGDGGKYCRYCGTKRGEGKFEPYQNMMQYYPPMPVKQVRECTKCKKTWETVLAIYGEKYCTDCGGSIQVIEQNGQKIKRKKFLGIFKYR